MWPQFVVADQARALQLDAMTSSHPIQVPIEHAEEVNEVFDAISYAKYVQRYLFIFVCHGCR
jgi:aminopeptidase N